MTAPEPRPAPEPAAMELSGELAGVDERGDPIRVAMTLTVTDITPPAEAPDEPVPAVEPMWVGLTANYADFDSHFRAFPDVAFCRTFAGPGEGTQPQPAESYTTLPERVAEWRSLKDVPTDAALIGYLDGITRPTVLTLKHEHDRHTQTRAAKDSLFTAWRRFHDVADAHPNRHLLTLVPIQTLQWTAALSNPTKGIVKGDRDWRTWWPGVGDGTGWDCYVDSWAERYPDVEEFFRIPLAAAEGTGRPLWVPELGSVRLVSDPTGAGRAAWIRDAVAFLREHGCRGVAWWCAMGTPGTNGEVRDFHLSDQASADAWRDAIQSS